MPLQDRSAQLVLHLTEFRQGSAGFQAQEGQDRTLELFDQGSSPKIGTVEYIIMDVLLLSNCYMLCLYENASM